MANADWYPQRLGDRIAWHTNFNTQALATGLARGLTAGQVSQITTDLNTVTVVVNALVAAEDYSESLTAYKDLVLDGDVGIPTPPPPGAPATISIGAGGLPSVQARTRQYAALIKAQPTYNPSIGELYGIVAPAPGAIAPPAIELATTTPGSSDVVLSLFKGSYDFIAIDMKRGGGAFAEIGRSMTASFTDTTPALVPGQPEQREYRCQGVSNNTRTGDLSDTVSAVTVP